MHKILQHSFDFSKIKHYKHKHAVKQLSIKVKSLQFQKYSHYLFFQGQYAFKRIKAKIS